MANDTQEGKRRCLPRLHEAVSQTNLRSKTKMDVPKRTQLQPSFWELRQDPGATEVGSSILTLDVDMSLLCQGRPE